MRDAKEVAANLALLREWIPGSFWDAFDRL
jgi:hypothetical protein